MAIEVFSIAAIGDSTASAAFNRFVSTHQVLSIQRRLIEDGAFSYWSILVDYREGKPESTATSKMGKGNRIDYRDLLEPEEFQRFVKLRELRKKLSEKEAVPVYTIFTNEQIAAIARFKTISKAALLEVSGVGESKIKKYGEAVLEALSPSPEELEMEASETSRKSDGEDCPSGES